MFVDYIGAALAAVVSITICEDINQIDHMLILNAFLHDYDFFSYLFLY